MTPVRQWLPASTELPERDAMATTRPSSQLYAVEVKPPRSKPVPATVEDFVRGIFETQSKLLGTKNTSPAVAYEFLRSEPSRLRLQFVVPTKRLERKVRTQLEAEIPGTGFDTGSLKLPVEPGETVGGGLLTTGRKHRYPLETGFDTPPINAVAATLHRHAMQDTKIVVQVLFQPVAGFSLREKWRQHRTAQTVEYLRKEKEKLWGSRGPTPMERSQADMVERKAGQHRFWVAIRFAVIGSGEYTPSRVKEIAAGFNRFESGESGQYLNIHTIRGVRRKPFLKFCRAFSDRRFGGYSHRFQATVEELAGLVSIPDRDQENLIKNV